MRFCFLPSVPACSMLEVDFHPGGRGRCPKIKALHCSLLADVFLLTYRIGKDVSIYIFLVECAEGSRSILKV